MGGDRCSQRDDFEKSGIGVDLVQRVDDDLRHAVHVFRHFVVPETKDSETLRLEPCRSFRIVIGAVGMFSAIDLDNHFGLHAGEIGDEAAERDLPSETMAVELFAAQLRPQFALGVGHILAETAGVFVR